MANTPESTPSAGDSNPNPESSGPIRDTNQHSNTTSNKHSHFPRFHAFWQRTKHVADLVGPTAFTVGVAFAVVAFIDIEIGRKLSTPEILRKIAAASRPAVIFDSNESIRSQGLGAESLIADNGKAIHVAKKKDGWPTNITIEFTKPVSDAPILTSLDETVVIIPKPGKGFSWDFEIHDIMMHGYIVSNRWLFRLELAP